MIRRKSKYGNKRVESDDGILFDSIKERTVYYALRGRLHAGEISDLRLQVPFELVPAVTETYVKHFVRKPDEERVRTVQDNIEYHADFVYMDNATGKEVVVDAKSAATRKNRVYLLKKKMMRALLGICIKEM